MLTDDPVPVHLAELWRTILIFREKNRNSGSDSLYEYACGMYVQIIYLSMHVCTYFCKIQLFVF